MLDIYRSLGSFIGSLIAVFVLAVLMLVPLLIAPRAATAAPLTRSQCRAGPVATATNQNIRHRHIIVRARSHI